MKRAFVAAFILFCMAVMVSQWRKAGPTESITHDLAPEYGQKAGIELQTPRSRAIRSSFSPLARVRSQPPTNLSPKNFVVEWRGHWYPAEVLQSDGSRKLIRYTGYGDEWNE